MVLPRAARYADPTTAVVQAWRGGGRWFTQQWTVAGFDGATQTLAFDAASGFQGGEGMTSAGQWWIENVLEELDDADEWFFDARAQRLYFQPNGTDGAPPPAGARFEAPLTKVLFNVSGTPAAPVRDLTIRGLVLRDAAPTYLDPHGMPSGGDWALQRSAAVSAAGTERLTVADNLFTRCDGNGVGLDGYHRNATVARNEFAWTGDTAVYAWGHTSPCHNENCSRALPYKVGPDGRGGEQPHGTLVEANLVRELGVWQKQSSMYFQAVAHTTTLRRNVHFNGPRAGINFNDVRARARGRARAAAAAAKNAARLARSLTRPHTRSPSFLPRPF